SAIEAVLALRPVVAGAPTAGRTPEGGYRTVRLVPPGDARATADALEEIIRSWSHIVRLLGASREAALRRHEPAPYRGRVNRAFGMERSHAPSPRTGWVRAGGAARTWGQRRRRRRRTIPTRPPRSVKERRDVGSGAVGPTVARPSVATARPPSSER